VAGLEGCGGPAVAVEGGRDRGMGAVRGRAPRATVPPTRDVPKMVRLAKLSRNCAEGGRDTLQRDIAMHARCLRAIDKDAALTRTRAL
jgi:hypothetical protein